MIRYLLPAVLLVGCGSGGSSAPDEDEVRDVLVAEFTQDPDVQEGCAGIVLVGDDGRAVLERQLARDIADDDDAFEDGTMDADTAELVQAMSDDVGPERFAAIVVDAMLEACMTKTDE